MYLSGTFVVLNFHAYMHINDVLVNLYVTTITGRQEALGCIHTGNHSLNPPNYMQLST